MIIDAAAHPTTNPEAFYGDPPGALPPFGGEKSYGLSLIVEILGGILSGPGAVGPEAGPIRNGVLMLCLDLARFLPLDRFHVETERLIRYFKSSPIPAELGEILVPGEPEERTRAERQACGLSGEEETSGQIQAIARELGVSF